MRTNVTFCHPFEFVPLSDKDGILAVESAQWFAALLRRIPGLDVDEQACQEDWGVVFFARRNQKQFWIGLSPSEKEGAWLVHFHHGSFAWLQRFSSSGKHELNRLLTDAHEILTSEPEISNIAWYEESEMTKPQPSKYSAPGKG